MEKALWSIYGVLFIEGAIIWYFLAGIKKGLTDIKNSIDALIKVLEKK